MVKVLKYIGYVFVGALFAFGFIGVIYWIAVLSKLLMRILGYARV
jgi:hypothetical protein